MRSPRCLRTMHSSLDLASTITLTGQNMSNEEPLVIAVILLPLVAKTR